MPCAALRPDVSRTLESLVEFEQALRILHREAWLTATADQRDAVLKRRSEDGVASMERSQYLRLHHRDLSFAQTVKKAAIFHTTMDGGKAKKAVRFVGDVQEVMAAPQDLLPIINHLKGIEGRLDKMKSEKSPTQSSTSPSTSTPAPPVPPGVLEVYHRTGSHQTTAGPRYGPPAPSASMPSAGSFQGPPRSFGPPRFSGTPRPPGPSGCSSPSGFRQPRPHLAGRWECGNRGCHSDFHQQNGTAPCSSGPPSPRLGFGNRGRRQDCWVCSRYGCHTVIEPRGSKSKSAAEIFIRSATYWSFGKLDPESDTGQLSPSPQPRRQSHQSVD